MKRKEKIILYALSYLKILKSEDNMLCGRRSNMCVERGKENDAKLWIIREKWEKGRKKLVKEKGVHDIKVSLPTHNHDGSLGNC